jgi:hypothetical protein
MVESTALIIAISSSLLSGLVTGLVATWIEHKKEVNRRAERDKDQLLLQLKDLQINAYQLQKDLDDWRLKYYNTLQELVEVKAELERTITKLVQIDPISE